MVQTHLLLMMKKTSPEYEESMRRYREAAKLFQGQVRVTMCTYSKKEHIHDSSEPLRWGFLK
jgi:hypothetical protein